MLQTSCMCKMRTLNSTPMFINLFFPRTWSRSPITFTCRYRFSFRSQSGNTWYVWYPRYVRAYLCRWDCRWSPARSLLEFLLHPAAAYWKSPCRATPSDTALHTQTHNCFERGENSSPSVCCLGTMAFEQQVTVPTMCQCLFLCQLQCLLPSAIP